MLHVYFNVIYTRLMVVMVSFKALYTLDTVFTSKNSELVDCQVDVNIIRLSRLQSFQL